MEGLSSARESDLQPESDTESAQDLSEEQEREQERAANAAEAPREVATSRHSAKRGATNTYRGSLIQHVDGSEGLCVYHESSPNKLLLATQLTESNERGWCTAKLETGSTVSVRISLGSPERTQVPRARAGRPAASALDSCACHSSRCSNGCAALFSSA